MHKFQQLILLVHKCILATKIGDSILRNEDGTLQFIYPDTFYEQGLKGYWDLRPYINTYKINKFLRS